MCILSKYAIIALAVVVPCLLCGCNEVKLQEESQAAYYRLLDPQYTAQKAEAIFKTLRPSAKLQLHGPMSEADTRSKYNVSTPATLDELLGNMHRSVTLLRTELKKGMQRGRWYISADGVRTFEPIFDAINTEELDNYLKTGNRKHYGWPAMEEQASLLVYYTALLADLNRHRLRAEGKGGPVSAGSGIFNERNRIFEGDYAINQPRPTYQLHFKQDSAAPVSHPVDEGNEDPLTEEITIMYRAAFLFWSSTASRKNKEMLERWKTLEKRMIRTGIVRNL